MNEFYPFFLIIFAGVFFSIVFRRINVPWVVALIFGGIIIGPHVTNLVKVTPALEFIGQIGLVFLMFMGGLETKLSSFREFKSGLLWLSFVNGAVPFFVGLGIGFLFGYGWTSSLLISIIFVSSSIAVVIPSLERYGLLSTRLGQSVVMTTIIQDVASLIMLSLFLQTISPITKLPLYIFYPLLFGVLIIFRLLLPRIYRFFSRQIKDERDIFQQEFRSLFLILIGTVIVFELLGLHPIIAGFFTGLVLAGSVTNEALKGKIRTISYGIFIPTFFVIIGTQTDITIFGEAQTTLPLVLAIIIGSVLSKFLSGWVGAKMIGFSSDQSLLFGVSSVPQLSTTLAVASAAFILGFIDHQLITSMVVLSVITTLISPTLMVILGNRIKKAIPEITPEKSMNK